MKTLKSKTSSEFLKQLINFQRVGEWEISFPNATLNKQSIQDALFAFETNFDWLNIHRCHISQTANNPQNNLWEAEYHGLLHDWFEQYQIDFNEDLPTIVVDAGFSTVVETSDLPFKDSETNHRFGSFTVYWDEDKNEMSVAIEIYYNFFTKAAYPYHETKLFSQVPYIDISPECRKQNRDLLANSLNGLAQALNGKVESCYSETIISYLTLYGFSDDCENEKIYDTTKGESYKPEP
jgi:hypothetical protein